MEVQAETQPGSSISYSSSESSSYVHPTSLILHGQMGYTRSKGIDLASAKRLLLVSNFYNANIAFALARLDSCNSSRSRCNGCNKTREGAILALIMIGRSSFFFCYLGHGNLVRAAVENIGFRCVYIYNFLDSVISVIYVLYTEEDENLK
ncbi:unnamed protein product [Brassica oleracea var. botrytis]